MAPQMYPASEGADYKFEVTVHERNVFEEPKHEQSLSWEKLKIGDIWQEVMIGIEQGSLI